MDLLIDSSKILPVYNNATVLVTGATGFLGRVLLEKLLRSCSVDKIYCLIRHKKNKLAHERFEQMLSCPIFEKVKNEKPDFKSKVFLVVGDCSMANLNLYESDRKVLIEQVQIIFHVAATIRFDQSLTTATNINVKGTQYLIELAKEMIELKALIYTSSAYSNCDKSEIHEVIYKTRFGVKNVLKLLENFNEHDGFLNQITPALLGNMPNTYVFTKGLAEELILEEAKLRWKLPVIIVRPSILSSTYKEPLMGWVDSWFTIGSISAAGSYGLLRTAYTKSNKLADIIPTDYAANCLIASVLTLSTLNHDDEVPVLNYVCSVDAPISWGKYTQTCFSMGMDYIPSKCVRYPYVTLTKYKFLHQLRVLYMHLLPAYFADIIFYVIGSTFSVRHYYKLLHNFLNDTSYFSTREWKFHNDNVKALWNSLPVMDQRTFPFSLEKFDWDEYLLEFLRNGRIHLLKESPENLPYSRKRLRILKLIHDLHSVCEYAFLLYLDYLLLRYFQIL